MNLKWSLWILLLMLGSCSKHRQDVAYHLIQVPSDLEVKSIEVCSDSLWFVTTGRSTLDGRLYRTIDAGSTWEQLIYLKSLVCIYDMLRLGDSTILIGGDVLYLYRSDDLGDSIEAFIDQTWHPADVNARGPIQHFASNGAGTILFAGGHSTYVGGYGVSFDTGRTFQYYQMNNQLSGVWMYGNTGYISGYGMVLKTVDGGHAFDTLAIRDEFFVDVDGASPDEVLLIAHAGKIFRTVDGGQNWKVVHNHSLLGNQRNLSDLYYAGGHRYFAIGNKGLVLESTDGGENWTQLSGLPKANLTCISGYQTSLFIGTEGGQLFRIEP